ncbi:MAG: TetR/AcrR family transcriptional regulator [Deltaproteobacteria bacterium]|nr:TetR/AcrR family transcriptional regulator [Deltaproteobacteria bacterium]
MAGRKSDPNKRSQILRAATDVFSAREFHTVPVEDVATAAGVGKGTLYLYFPNKEQLFYATILEALDVLLAELADAVRGRSGEPALRAFTRCFLTFFWTRRHLAVLMGRYEHKQREPEGASWRQRRERVIALAREVLKPETRAARIAPADAVLAAEMLIALIRAAVTNQQERDDPERSVDFVVDLFLDGLRGGRAVARRPGARPRRAAAGGQP